MTGNLTPESINDSAACRSQLVCAGIFPESSDDLTQDGLHQLVEEQAARAPRAIAVQAADGTSLTYQQLDQRANQLAHTLRRLGVAPEVCVGLYLERSPELLVALLAILKAGGAYVPLDPGYPTDRLTFMLRESHAQALLTRRSLPGRLPVEHVRRLCLDDWDFLESEPVTALPVRVDARNLAYVIYTSGSTGQPKGVMVTHGAARHFTRVARRAFALTPQDCVLQFASLSFDTSVEEIFPCLGSGAALLLRSPDLPGSAERFFAQCQQRQVSVLDLPTAYWHELCEQLEQASRAGQPLCWPTTLRLVIIGGEQARLERFEQWQRCVPPGVRLLNTYGPTETTVAATLWEAPGNGDSLAQAQVPIGQPFAGVETYVLDESMQLVPPGGSGELYVGGPGVARGYLGDPGATAQRFVPHPWSAGGGARLYRTGDRVRQRLDGQLEWLGRLDQQVKVRGYRIELGEIEQVLRSYPGVREAVVVAWEGELAAYLLNAHQQRPDEQEEQVVRAYLRERVPGYLVPRWVTWVQAWPLTPAGKLDRHALPPPHLALVHQEPTLVEPRTPIEEIIADIWANVLGIEQVSIHDDFFALGGHSLLAARIMARVYEAFQIELSLATFFEMPTVAGLAAQIERANNIPGMHMEALPLPDVPQEEPLPLSYAQQRLWFLDQLQPGNAAYHIATAVRLTGRLDMKALEWSLNEVVRRHGALRTTFTTAEGHPVQIVSAAQHIALPVKDLRELPPAERDAEVRHHAESCVKKRRCKEVSFRGYYRHKLFP